jgi:hypothetical protein
MSDLTDSDEPRPSTREITWHEQVGHDGVQHKDPAPHIERVMPVIRQQEGVMDATVCRQDQPTVLRHG